MNQMTQSTVPIKELDDDMKNFLRHINEYCMKIHEQQNLNCTFNKIESGTLRICAPSILQTHRKLTVFFQFQEFS